MENESKESKGKMIIKIETNDLSEDEAENLMEYMLINYGWACFVDKIAIGSKKFYDIDDESWMKYVNELREMKVKRRKRLQKLGV